MQIGKVVMASKSNSGFDNGGMNFGTVYSLRDTIPKGSKFELNDGSNGMMYSEISSIIDNKPFSVEWWSVDEQKKLEEGLVKYADEPYIMKYIKIASTLRDKTIRDVALRCRWTTLKVYRAIEQVRAEKKRVSSELELLQYKISQLNSEIDHLRSNVSELSLCANPLSSSLRDLEAREAELLATLGF